MNSTVCRAAAVVVVVTPLLLCAVDAFAVDDPICDKATRVVGVSGRATITGAAFDGSTTWKTESSSLTISDGPGAGLPPLQGRIVCGRSKDGKKIYTLSLPGWATCTQGPLVGTKSTKQYTNQANVPAGNAVPCSVGGGGVWEDGLIGEFKGLSSGTEFNPTASSDGVAGMGVRWQGVPFTFSPAQVLSGGNFTIHYYGDLDDHFEEGDRWEKWHRNVDVIVTGQTFDPPQTSKKKPK